jgi:hypothetical protein
MLPPEEPKRSSSKAKRDVYAIVVYGSVDRKREVSSLSSLKLVSNPVFRTEFGTAMKLRLLSSDGGTIVKSRNGLNGPGSFVRCRLI